MPLNGITVLVVEDDKDGREINRRMLAQLGATVLLAENGAIALKILEDNRPDLILCDLKMPVMDGFEFGRQVRMNLKFRHTRLVALTALNDEHSYLRTWSLGFDGHLEKPVTLDKMEGLARYLSGGHRPWS